MNTETIPMTPSQKRRLIEDSKIRSIYMDVMRSGGQPSDAVRLLMAKIGMGEPATRARLRRLGLTATNREYNEQQQETDRRDA